MFRQPPSLDINASNPLLIVQEPKIVRARDRPRDAENKSRKEIAFNNSTARKPSRFEHVVMETATNDEVMPMKIERVIQRADPTPQRGRERETRRDRATGRTTREGRRGRSAPNLDQD